MLIRNLLQSYNLFHVLIKIYFLGSDLSDRNYTCISLLGEGRSIMLLQYKLYPVPALSRNDIDWNPDPIP